MHTPWRVNIKCKDTQRKREAQNYSVSASNNNKIKTLLRNYQYFYTPKNAKNCSRSDVISKKAPFFKQKL